MPLIETENDYNFIRTYLSNKLTISKHRIVSNIATTIVQNNKDTINSSFVSEQLDKTSKSTNNLIIRYTHETRFQTFKNDIHQL